MSHTAISLVVGGAIALLAPASSGNVYEAFQHLDDVMDQFHECFYVYSDFCAGGNHGFSSGWMGDLSALEYDGNSTNTCFSGRSCIRINFTSRSNNWAGIIFQSVEDDWGTVSNGGFNLTGATKLTFAARGEAGGERVEFFAGSVSGTYGDSFPKISTGYITLSSSWQEYELDLTGQDMSHVVGLFGFVLNTSNDPNGATFYIDQIRYNKSDLNAPRFLNSYHTLACASPDAYLHNVCFIYDECLAVLAYLARGTADDLERARLLADALVFAQGHDRYYTDGRLRNAYMSGDLADHMTGKARLWDEEASIWYEEVSSYTGNLAWAILALVAYYEQEGGAQYLDAAIQIGEWIENHTNDEGGAEGYTGGYAGWEPSQTKITWKSTEHNLDVHVAFKRLYNVTGDAKWLNGALQANSFVDSMWNEAGGHFWTGTLDDGVTVNTNTVPLDIHAWAVMAFTNTDYSALLNWAEDNCRTTCHGFTGFDFNTDKDGVWFEGTAQMTLAYEITGEEEKAVAYVRELCRLSSMQRTITEKELWPHAMTG